MTDTNAKKHTDIKRDGWIARCFPPVLLPYIHLMRLDRPVGIWLLLLPGWWAIMLAAGGGSGIEGYAATLLLLFAVGAVIMRAAGCIVNDLWDRELDAKVARTAQRPLAAGTISKKRAFFLLLILLLCGFWILCRLPLAAFLLGLMTLPLIALYPLMKRLTWWPQLFLGITFNFGVLMGWAAINGTLSLPALLLYAGGIFWTLGYDTIYAHQDREDDMRAGIKSTALLFGANSKNYVTIFYAAAMLCFFFAFKSAGAGWLSLSLLIPAGLHLAGQIRAWDMDDPENSLAMFKSSQAFGLLVLIAAIL